MTPLMVGLYREERGASIIELALTLPILGFLLLGSVDMGMGYTKRLSLQQAANRTLEMGVVRGEVNSSYSYLQDVGASVSGQPSSNVTIDNWLACDNVRQSSFDGTCGSSEQTARYLSVKIVGSYQPVINYAGLATRFGQSDVARSVTIGGSSVVRIQ